MTEQNNAGKEVALENIITLKSISLRVSIKSINFLLGTLSLYGTQVLSKSNKIHLIPSSQSLS